MHLFRGRTRSCLAVIVVVVVVLIGWGVYFFVTSRANAEASQPIAFPHKAMVQIGVQCLYCHQDARRSPAAGMPSVKKCMDCHRYVNPNNPAIQQVAAYWNRQEAIPWVRMNNLPRFVYFSHQVHVDAAGLNCERCHGNVGQMTIAVPVVQMNMGWCLDCHEQQPNANQLRDCVVCHK